MEKKHALSSSLKDHSVSHRISWHPKNPWHNSHTCNHSSSDHDCPRGCSWPPRSYPCTYCNREFRSAQALGGHMNVHRRDRARLRHSTHMEQTNTFYHHQQQHQQQQHQQQQQQEEEEEQEQEQEQSAADYPILTLSPNPNFAFPSSTMVSPPVAKTMICFSPVMVKSKPVTTTHQPAAVLMGTDLQLRGGSSADDPYVDLELRLGR